MPSLVSINGRILAEKKAGIPVGDSAYLLGYGVFETLVSHRGRVLFLREHYERMRRNAARLGLRLPHTYPSLRKETARILNKSRLREAYIRFNLSESLRGRPRFVIIVRPYEPYPAACYKSGGKLILVRSTLNDPAPIAGIKSTNYLTKMLGRKEAARKGAVEGILLNAKGHVTEGASSNLFIVKKGRLITPPLSEGLMPGTRRAVVLKLARKLGIPIQERILLPTDLRMADEIFITSTLKDVLPICTFEGKKIGKLTPGPITRQLMKAFFSFESGCRW